MGDNKLPEWPERPFFADTSDFDWCSYYQRLAAYWETRCRVAFSQMRHAGDCVKINVLYEDALNFPDRYPCTCRLEEAYELIGPLPDPTEGG